MCSIRGTHVNTDAARLVSRSATCDCELVFSVFVSVCLSKTRDARTSRERHTVRAVGEELADVWQLRGAVHDGRDGHDAAVAARQLPLEQPCQQERSEMVHLQDASSFSTHMYRCCFLPHGAPSCVQ